MAPYPEWLQILSLACLSSPSSLRASLSSMNCVALGAFTMLDPTPGTAEAYRRTGKFPDRTV
jgi:hypothetical protein